MCILLKLQIMQSLMFLDCFVQKVSKKNLLGVGSTHPPPLVKEALTADLGISPITLLVILSNFSESTIFNHFKVSPLF